jgi:hypothetical protein
MDYTSFEEVGKDKAKKKQKITPPSKMWWKTDIKDRAAAVTDVVQRIYDNDKIRQNQYLKSMRLYGNISPFGTGVTQLGSIPTPSAMVSDRLTYNVIQSAGDTVTAKIAKNKPKPLFLTSGGSYKLQRRAKKLDKFVQGIFYENNTYVMGPEIFRDSYVIGDGFIQVYALEGRVKHERVLAGELFTDYADSIYGKPSQLHRVKLVDIDALIGMFPAKEKEIRANAEEPYVLGGSSTKVTDQLAVCESWHLPSGVKAKDGCHTINILGGDNLLDEPYDKSGFPFARLPWSKRMIGFFSQGGAEQIQPTQLEINKILWTLQRSYHLAGTFKVWIKTGGKIVREHINNEIGSVVESEEMPQYLTPPIVPPEMYAHLDKLIQRGFEQSGASQLSATSKKPDGLDSGKALREYNNIETERFMLNGQAYEQFFVDLAKLSVDCAREIAKNKKDFKVKSPNAKFIETIEWKDVELAEEDMITKIFPISSLPSDPAGRMQTIQEWVQAGWFTSRTGKKLMDFPDLEMVEDLQSAKEDYLHFILGKMVDDGEYTPPEPFDDLPLAKELFAEYYAQGKLNGLEEAKLNHLRTFNDQVDVLMEQAMAGSQPPPPPPPGSPDGSGQPQATPEAPPQSDLLTNAPVAA